MKPTREMILTRALTLLSIRLANLSPETDDRQARIKRVVEQALTEAGDLLRQEMEDDDA